MRLPDSTLRLIYDVVVANIWQVDGALQYGLQRFVGSMCKIVHFPANLDFLVIEHVTEAAVSGSTSVQCTFAIIWMNRENVDTNIEVECVTCNTHVQRAPSVTALRETKWADWDVFFFSTIVSTFERTWVGRFACLHTTGVH